jgi:dienelactone hydrolase
MLINIFRLIFFITAWFVLAYFIWIFQAQSDFSGYINSLLPEDYDVQLTEIQSNDSVSIQQLIITSADDSILEAYIKNPKTNHKIPGIVLLGGVMTNKMAVEYAYDVDNVVLVSPDYPYKVRYRYGFFNILGDLIEARNALHYQVRDNILLMDFLDQWERIDRSKIGIIGYSFGVPFAVATASVYPKISNLCLVYGGANLKYLMDLNLNLFNPIIDKLLVYLFWFHVMDFEPLRHAKNIKALPMIIINGKDDEKIPYDSAEQLQKAFDFKKEVVWIPSAHVHPRNKKLSLEIIKILKKWFESTGITVN